MSRSKRKSPYGPRGARRTSEKWDKMICNRRIRRLPQDMDLPNGKKIQRWSLDVWNMKKDGKATLDPKDWKDMKK